MFKEYTVANIEISP